MKVRGRVIAIAVGAVVAAAGAPATAGAAAPYVLAGMYPGLAQSSTFRASDVNQGTPDLTAPYAFYQHTGKGQAVINLFGGADTVTQYFANIWDSRNSIPMLSFFAPDGAETAMGLHDAQLTALITALQRYAFGADGAPGGGDDRKAYLRYGWESNNKAYSYSACDGGSGFGDGWRYAHQKFTDAGLDNKHIAWVFSEGSKDSCPAGAPEAKDASGRYTNWPGSAFVDWLGMDLYSTCGGSVQSSSFGMDGRLRALDSTKPLSIDEAGVWVPNDDAQADGKNGWIQSYWSYVSTDDIRMSVWFNADPGPNYSGTPACEFPQPWAVISPNHGNDVFTAWDSEQHLTSRAWHTFPAYAAGLAAPGVMTSRLGVTDDQFLGK